MTYERLTHVLSENVKHIGAALQGLEVNYADQFPERLD